MKKKAAPRAAARKPVPELAIVTGLSGSGKGSALRALEDSGFHAVDNLPVGLIPKFAELVRDSASSQRAAIVVDIRDGAGLKKLPGILEAVRKDVRCTVIFLEASDETLMRRFSETRRPHPLASDEPVTQSIARERKLLRPIRALADLTIDTSRFNVHDLRALVRDKFEGSRADGELQTYVTSFGFRHGLPADCDLVFDVRFLPNPNYIPKFKKLTGRNPDVAKYIRSFPQTDEFIARVSELLQYLMPHYIREGKSYLTIGFGCTGGHHRSVMMAEEVGRRLNAGGYPAKVAHRDIQKPV